MRRLARPCLAMTLALVVAGPAAASPLRLGFFDYAYEDAAPGGPSWLDRTSSVGADIVRLDVRWSTIAAKRPAAEADPGDAAYDWSALDAAVSNARSRGLDVLLSVERAPNWAEGANRPGTARNGTWKPSPDALGAFAQALAARYDGSHFGLPRVHEFQAWNEPNLSVHLSPQWDGDTMASPGLYRSMLASFYSGVKRSQPHATVVSAGTAPFGDPTPGGDRIQPVAFVRGLFCLDRALRRVCSAKVHMDALDHHPYSVRGPDAPALNADDASVPDMGKFSRVLQAAKKAGTLAGAIPPLWVTELAWDSSPPDPNGVPEQTQARWLEGAFYRLWRQGVRTITWFLVGDQAPVPSYGATYQSGVYLLDGKPKPSAQAFRFPFVAEHASSSEVRIWGRTPAPGRVQIQRRSGGVWRTVDTATPGSDRVFLKRIRAKRGWVLRASQDGQRSLSWTVGS